MCTVGCASGSTVTEPPHGELGLRLHSGVSSLKAVSHSVTSRKAMLDGENMPHDLIAYTSRVTSAHCAHARCHTSRLSGVHMGAHVDARWVGIAKKGTGTGTARAHTLKSLSLIHI